MDTLVFTSKELADWLREEDSNLPEGQTVQEVNPPRDRQ